MRTPARSKPDIVLLPLPEDVAQSICHITAILDINDDPAIEPGELEGMSHMLEHALLAKVEMEEGSMVGWLYS